MSKVYKAVMNCKSFYVGDPCYVMPDDLYSKYGCSCDDLSGNGDTDGGIGTTPEGEVVSVLHSTDHGDGCYDGYDVDSGQIGVVNGDFCEDTRGFCKTISGKAEVELEYDEDGTFYITVTDPETGLTLFSDQISTGWTGEDGEDDYDEDYWKDHYSEDN